MSCNSCAKSFTFLRKEKGCPACGFSYCTKCLDNKVFLPKLNSEAKVCAKCKRTVDSKEEQKMEPPDAYFKRLGSSQTINIQNVDNKQISMDGLNDKDKEILERLQKLKENSKTATKGISEEEIAKRLQKLKGETPTTSDAELNERLSKLKGISLNAVQAKPVLPAPDCRSEQEQVNDLMKQYLDQTKIDTKYKNEFDGVVNDIESRLQNLKSKDPLDASNASKPKHGAEYDDEDDTIRKIIEKAKAESSLEDELPASTNDELPFCEICNEDANVRCLGCRYLFCRRCFLEHKDDDDGCDKYEQYRPPPGAHYT